MGDAGPSASMRTDADVLRDTYRFVRTEEDNGTGKAWEVDLAKRYESKLYRDVALVDLSKYKKGKYGCRWRTKGEVVAGKGETSCGALDCAEQASLETFEVPFSYAEDGREKLALVKVRLCQKHAMQLNYKKLKASMKEEKRKREREAKAREKQAKERRKRKRSAQAAEEPPDTGGSGPAARPKRAEQLERQDRQDAIQKEADDFLAQLV